MAGSFNLAQLAQEAGFSGNDLITAVAIALAESGGNPYAYNPETQAGTPTGQGSYGLWQIYQKAHPAYTGSQLLDPSANASAAYDIYNSSGFSAWSTYKNGSYQNYLSEAAGMVSALDVPAPTAPLPDVSDGFGAQLEAAASSNAGTLTIGLILAGLAGVWWALDL